MILTALFYRYCREKPCNHLQCTLIKDLCMSEQKLILLFKVNFQIVWPKFLLHTYSVFFLSPKCLCFLKKFIGNFLHRKTYLIPKESEHWDSRMKLLFFTAQFPEGYFLPLCCHKTKGQILFSCC